MMALAMRLAEPPAPDTRAIRGRCCGGGKEDHECSACGMTGHPLINRCTSSGREPLTRA